MWNIEYKKITIQKRKIVNINVIMIKCVYYDMTEAFSLMFVWFWNYHLEIWGHNEVTIPAI